MLGYEDVGDELRSEFRLPSGQIVDFVTMGRGDDVRDPQTVVYEFKAADRALDRHEEQLFGYMTELTAEYGVLTNGRSLSLYANRTGEIEKLFQFDLESATEENASHLTIPLGYLSIAERNLRAIAEDAAERVIEEAPPELHLDFSEKQLDVFAEHFGEYLREEYRTKRSTE